MLKLTPRCILSLSIPILASDVNVRRCQLQNWYTPGVADEFDYFIPFAE